MTSSNDFEVSRDAEGRAFLIEWKGEQVHGLAFAKRGKVAYRTADGRVLGRATVIDELVRRDSLAANPRTPEAAETPARDEQVASSEGSHQYFHEPEPASPSGHWAGSIPAPAPPLPATPMMPPPVPEPPFTRIVPPAGVLSPLNLPLPTPPQVHPGGGIANERGDQELTTPVGIVFDGHRWVGTDATGAQVIVWDGQPALSAIDDELAYLALRSAHLTELRARTADSVDERERRIQDSVVRLAEADGVHDIAAASNSQITAWRRYAEVMVGER